MTVVNPAGDLVAQAQLALQQPDGSVGQAVGDPTSGLAGSTGAKSLARDPDYTRREQTPPSRADLLQDPREHLHYASVGLGGDHEQWVASLVVEPVKSEVAGMDRRICVTWALGN